MEALQTQLNALKHENSVLQMDLGRALDRKEELKEALHDSMQELA